MIPQVGSWISRSGSIARVQGMLIENGEVVRLIVCTTEDKIQRWEPAGVVLASNPFDGPEYQPAA